MTNVKPKEAFTLIELLLAVSLMAVIIVVGFVSFNTVNRIWRVGTNASSSIQHADFVLEQLAMALRSAYYPDSAKPSPAYGMTLVSEEDGNEAHDSLSWIKLGSALVGKDSLVSSSPHRIIVSTISPGESDIPGFENGGLIIKAWRISALPEDFDPEDEEYVKPLLVSSGITGLDFQLLDPDGNLLEGKSPTYNKDSIDDGLKWITEEWRDDYTNRLPYAVEATLHLPPSEKDGEPISIKRVITIPASPLSWRDKGAAGGSAETGGNKKNNTKNSSNRFGREKRP